MSGTSDQIGIDFLSVLGMPPVAFIAMVRSLGCSRITLGLAPMTANPHDYPAWSLRTDPQLRRDTMSALADHDVAVALAEGCFLMPSRPAASFAADLDIMASLGIGRISIVSLDSEGERAMDEVAALVHLAAERGISSAIEFLPGRALGTLADALATLAHVARPDAGIVIDMMHVFRSGETVAQLAALDPALVSHIQLCDIPLVNDELTYAEESLHERLIPGQGELPLAPALEALPRNVTVGLEIPMLSQARAGVGPRDRLQPAIEAAQLLLAGGSGVVG
ncbi:sugar phosphate isomerase/epimerase family protein [Sphingobium boeckii]|uniref:Sugar phosphate isomerase/epimerase n=1 Tax=Sphingobium boeckii TaxID=1082345 RepID=A0A7W9EF19_9SPHN|nr:sugar phosphate isomerase/epimerase [Sphingobium boeckii]MBB5686777.1 sugar phosphate isomerase/epimerase [Sphingobium boeckii]